MPKCPACDTPFEGDNRFCGHCGAELPTVAPSMTRTTPGPSAPASSLDQGRFTSGTVLAERYRIVGLLGRGGMGEVFKAEDLKLGQPVALKFLPVAREKDDSRQARLLNEVRLARTVSHPNVCRVYDVGEVEGSAFMAMEFVDGEDLASLLRRIGRLPQEKGLEIARQICAGLAAAHEQGILHRDLKPANIMIDGKGKVKLADFGLADVSSGLEGEEARSGTPAYMAPEQLAGREVTVRSDIFALGLVLYEIFTGEAVYKGRSLDEILREHEQPTPTQPSTLVTGLDDTIERVILRCLEKEPASRPASALAVAAALPGGDPLAAALAAGETPSPEMVADAGSVGGLKPTMAWALLAGFLILLVASTAGFDRYSLISQVDPPLSTGVLKEKARELVRSLRYDAPFRDSTQEFEYNADYVRHLQGLPSIRERQAQLVRPQPSALRFAYRQSPEWITYSNPGSVTEWVARTSNAVPGDLRIRLDTTSRLVHFEVSLPDSVGPVGQLNEPDWNMVLSAAGFDPSELEPADPEWLPGVSFDLRRAWTGVYPEAPEVPVRIEASSLAGRLVHFRIIEPWTLPRIVNRRPLLGFNAFEGLAAFIFPTLFVGSLITVSFLALRNLQRGRGDRRTAVRFAFALAALRMAWYVFGRHYPNANEIDVLVGNLAWAMWRFGFAYAFYVALEPYVRKLWPHMLTSWVRLFDNRFKDPLVGRDILVGMVLAALVSTVTSGMLLVLDTLGLDFESLGISDFNLASIDSIRSALLGVVGTVTNIGFIVFMMVTFIFLMRLLFRRDSLTLIPLILLLIGFNIGNHPIVMVVGLVFPLALWTALFRFGLLTFVTFFLVSDLISRMPITLNVGAWWAVPGWMVLVVLLGLAIWSFRISLAGRAAFRDTILDD